MSKLNKAGCIPAGQECPWKDTCHLAEDNYCLRPLVINQVFSCGIARAYDLIGDDELIPNKPNLIGWEDVYDEDHDV